MKNTKIIHAIGNVGDDLIERSATKNMKSRKKITPLLKWLMPTAACLIIALVIVVPLLNNNSDFDYMLSGGVKVSYIDNPPNIFNTPFLMAIPEDELFAEKWDSWEIVAFEGTVVKIQNIVIDYGDSYKDYRAIATIEVSRVYRGDIETGEHINILLPSPVGGNVIITDTEVSAQMTVGTSGIFMPIKYDEAVTREENGRTLALIELAEYGFTDGVRWAFLDKPDGVVFARHAYLGILEYESVEGSPTMDEIRQYVIAMLER